MSRQNRLKAKNLFFPFLLLLCCSGTILPVYAAEMKPLDNLQGYLISREITDLCSKSAEASERLEGVLRSLGRIQELTSSRAVESALREVLNAQALKQQTEADLKALAGYVDRNRKALEKEGLEDLIPLAELDDRTFSRHAKALDSYLASFRTLLEFLRHGSDDTPATEKDRQERQEELFNAYVEALTLYNDRSEERAQYLGKFLREHPQLRDLFPR
ncbi:MAG: hypothetical protein HYS23_13995 [Geobacter sp.]|nr:hypothetical protein [Geobacter sp.]